MEFWERRHSRARLTDFQSVIRPFAGRASEPSVNWIENEFSEFTDERLQNGGGRLRARVNERAELGMQTDALARAGCAPLFEDTASGAKADRPGLKDALNFVREGDLLIVWKLDRLGRSLPHLIETASKLEARGVGFRSLTASIDTTTPSGRLIFHVFGALGQFERDLIRERTRAGLEAAVARGRQGGRKPVVTVEKLRRAQALVDEV